LNNYFAHFIRYQFPAVLWALLIFWASSIPATKLPTLAHFINDKVIHIIFFFVLGLLVYRALEPRKKPERFNWKRLLISIAAVVLYGVFDEFHQSFVPGRTVDVLDATADAIGGILSALVLYIATKRKESKL
jgi:VanZ family protein